MINYIKVIKIYIIHKKTEKITNYVVDKSCYFK